MDALRLCQWEVKELRSFQLSFLVNVFFCSFHCLEEGGKGDNKAVEVGKTYFPLLSEHFFTCHQRRTGIWLGLLEERMEWG